MKKLVSFLLAIALVFSFSILACAEEQIEIPEYHWADAEPVFKEEFAGRSTQWYIDEVDASMWLPDSFVLEELTAEDQAQGIIRIFGAPDGSNFILMSYSDAENFNVISVYAGMKEAGDDVQLVSVNDIPAVLIRDAENGNLVLLFETREHKAFQVIFIPLEDEEFFELVIDSIQPYVEDVETAPAPVNPVSGLISK